MDTTPPYFSRVGQARPWSSGCCPRSWRLRRARCTLQNN